MNRKKFLKTVSTGVLAASLLPLLSFTKNRTSNLSKSTFKSKKETNINGKMWNFELKIDNALLSDFDSTGKKERNLIIYANDYEIFYVATSMKRETIDSKDLLFFECKLDRSDMTKEAKKFVEESFGKYINVEVHRKCHAVVKDNKSKLSVSFQYSAPKDIDADLDCFLTSATVFHRGLSDDCKELTTLRNLRENVMKPDPNYFQLISEYEIIAPKMLANINVAVNKEEILESIYNNLILPSVSLVEKGKNIEAIEHYRDFVQEMKALYL